MTSSTSSGWRSEKNAPIEYSFVSMRDSRNESRPAGGSSSSKGAGGYSYGTLGSEEVVLEAALDAADVAPEVSGADGVCTETLGGAGAVGGSGGRRRIGRARTRRAGRRRRRRRAGRRGRLRHLRRLDVDLGRLGLRRAGRIGRLRRRHLRRRQSRHAGVAAGARGGAGLATGVRAAGGIGAPWAGPFPMILPARRAARPSPRRTLPPRG